MASMKAEKPVGSQLYGQTKKVLAKAGESGESKTPAIKQTSKKAEQKPREQKKKGGKPGAKNSVTSITVD